MANRHGGGRRRGLTLIEILASIAVISILVGVLVPAWSAVRGGARRAVCLTQERQMAFAASQYGLAYGHYPPALRYEIIDGVFTTIAWDFIQGADGSVRPGPLWQFADDPSAVQQCPDYHGHSNFGNDPYTGYNYNTTYVGGESSFPSLGWNGFRAGVRPSACRHPGRCAMIGDGGWAGGTNKFMRAPMNTVEESLQTVYAGAQAFRHGGATNVAYVDGHVDSVTAPSPGDLATDALLAQTLDYPRNGFLSNDDRAYDPD